MEGGQLASRLLHWMALKFTMSFGQSIGLAQALALVFYLMSLADDCRLDMKAPTPRT